MNVSYEANNNKLDPHRGSAQASLWNTSQHRLDYSQLTFHLHNAAGQYVLSQSSLGLQSRRARFWARL